MRIATSTYEGEIPQSSGDPLDPNLADVKPRVVAYWFDELRKTPRESKNEAQIMNLLHTWALEHGFECPQDKAGNICIKVPGSNGYTNKPPVCLQAHADMVCVQEEGGKHDFTKDPIKLRRKGKLLKAQGTSAGFDDGMGVAEALAIACDPNAVHPPLEILITVDEEGEMTGAKKIDFKALGMKSAVLLNLDNEDLGKTFTSSAGVRELRAEKDLERQDPEAMKDGEYFEISVSGMVGGHSGDDINKFRGNAIFALYDMLARLPDEVRLVSINGGQKTNAIPTGAKAVVFVPKTPDQKKIEAALAGVTDGMPSEWRGMIPNAVLGKVESAIADVQSKIERNFHATVKVTPKSKEEIGISALTDEVHAKIMHVLGHIQDGIIEMDPAERGFVMTSSNIGVLSTDAEKIQFTAMIRSGNNARMNAAKRKMQKLLRETGFRSKLVNALAAWHGDPHSRLARYAQEAYAEATGGRKGKIGGVHAGLENGPLVTRLEAYLGRDVESISFGPTISDPHSTNESFDVESSPIFDLQLRGVLRRLAQEE